jgi:hypothetical protein
LKTKGFKKNVPEVHKGHEKLKCYSLRIECERGISELSPYVNISRYVGGYIATWEEYIEKLIAKLEGTPDLLCHFV